MEPTKSIKPTEVDAFLDTVARTIPAATNKSDRGKLIFALDATASRQATWDRAAALQGDMFTNTRGIGQLDMQLVFYRGYNECKSSPWLDSPVKLLEMMNKVSCAAGHTQIGRVLKHAIAETRQQPVQAMVFIGDCVEESVDELGNLAGQLKLLNLPVFLFQEGYDPVATAAFAQIAAISGGAHCRFNHNAVNELGQLLNAVAAYAAGGKNALLKLTGQSGTAAAQLLKQLG